MSKHFSADEEVSTHEHFHRVETQGILSPAEMLQENEDAAEKLRDECAEALRAVGCAGLAAQRYVGVVLAVIRKRERSVVADRAGSAMEKALAEVARLQENEARQLETMAQIWAWPDARKGVGAWFFAKGERLYGVASMRALAEMRGVSVEDVSNVVDAIQRINGWERNAFQKSEEAVKAYERANGARGQSREAA
jgi:hypothetical protein